MIMYVSLEISQHSLGSCSSVTRAGLVIGNLLHEFIMDETKVGWTNPDPEVS